MARVTCCAVAGRIGYGFGAVDQYFHDATRRSVVFCRLTMPFDRRGEARFLRHFLAVSSCCFELNSGNFVLN